MALVVRRITFCFLLLFFSHLHAADVNVVIAQGWRNSADYARFVHIVNQKIMSLGNRLQ